MKRLQPTILNFGRHRTCIYIGWNPRRFKWMTDSLAPGHRLISFGFGLINYTRRNYDK